MAPYVDSRRFLAKCSPERFQRETSIVGAEHRGIKLCNFAGLDGEEFAMSHNYFKNKVDTLYQEYYIRIVEKSVSAIMYAIAGWLMFLLFYGIYRWIKRGA